MFMCKLTVNSRIRIPSLYSFESSLLSLTQLFSLCTCQISSFSDSVVTFAILSFISILIALVITFNSSSEEKARTLKTLLDEGLITPEDYTTKMDELMKK